MSRYFTAHNEVLRHYRRFNAEGRELTVRMMAPPPLSTAARDPARHFNAEGRKLTVRMLAPPPLNTSARDPARHFAKSVDELFEYSFRDLEHSDVVGISIYNAHNHRTSPSG
jgi:hypothetical protein